MEEPTRPSSTLPRSIAEVGAITLDRLSSFRVVYISIFLSAAVYVISLDVAEILLQRHFEAKVERALAISPADGPIIPQIRRRIRSLVQSSAWIRLGEVRVRIHIYGADGVTPLYLEGRAIPSPLNQDPIASMKEAVQLLPASSSIDVSVPPTGVLAMVILVGYGAVLITSLFFYNRAVAARGNRLLETAIDARDGAAERASTIEAELEVVRGRLRLVEPNEQLQEKEIAGLQRERRALQTKLVDLEDREAELRRSAARSIELEQERQALEELLDEASDDLGNKEEEIRGLQDRLKNASKNSGTRARGVEPLARRLRTLYKTVEIDDRAIQDIVRLREESMKLKAEECIKRLADDSDLTSTRRKVGGLPPQLTIFELGFAGKGRLYYTRGKNQRYRVVLVGAKNSQKTDLEHLSRLPAS